MTGMKVWKFEEEWYVATSASDAEAARVEATGPCDEYADDTAEKVPGDTVLRCTFDERSDVPPWVPDSAVTYCANGDGCYVELTAAEWAAGNGRGYLMGTNW